MSKMRILVEERTSHALDIDIGSRVAHETALFQQLTTEEIDTEIAVLRGLRRSADPDHLAHTTLEDDQVSDANELTWDSNDVTRSTSRATIRSTDCINLHVSDATRMVMVMSAAVAIVLADDDFFTIYTIAAMVMTMVVERVQDTVGSSLDTTTEGVVLTVVIVVAHVVSVVLIETVSGTSTVVSFSDVDVCFEAATSCSPFVIDVDLFSRSSSINVNINAGSVCWASMSGSLLAMEQFWRKY